MALSESQKTAVRRYAGYPILSSDPAFADPAVINVPGQYRTLAYWLDNLSEEQEVVLTDTYLANLVTLEAAIPAMSEGLDTSGAATWRGNPLEMSQRIRLFNKWRREMCSFIGVEPGPGLASGGNIIRG